MAEPMDWLNQPPEWRDEDGVLTLVTGDRTDFWQRTHYGFVRDDGHARLTPSPGDFSATVAFHGDYETLYDQAGLLGVYAEAAALTGRVDFAETALGIHAYVTRDLRLPSGLYASAEDAYSLAADGPHAGHMHEGAFYTWTPPQLVEARQQGTAVGEAIEADALQLHVRHAVGVGLEGGVGNTEEAGLTGIARSG